IVMIYTYQVARSLQRGLSIQEIGTQIDQGSVEAGVRVLVLDSRGMDVYGTEDHRVKARRFPITLGGGRRPNVAQGTLSTPSGEAVFIVGPAFSPGSGLRVAVLAPEQSLTNAWREALPRLTIAAIGALIVSIMIAWWLASTITRPLLQI